MNREPWYLAAYIGSRCLSELAYQIAAVAIGWQVYLITHSPLALGLVALLEFLPSVLLVFPAGHLADRFNRARIAQLCQAFGAAVSLIITTQAVRGSLSLAALYAAVVALGAAGACESPAVAALLPVIVPGHSFQKATAISTSGFQIAMIAGPAVGGVALAASPALAYALMSGFWFGAACALFFLPAARGADRQASPGLEGVFEGVRFVRRTPLLLATMSLDLFAVLFGGATTLLPIYARDILHVGPGILGVLRCAPSIGAVLTAAWLSRHPLRARTGQKLLQAVIVFGLATVVFAVSRTLWLSLLALAILGAADAVSVVIRVAMVQLATPNALRGRVSAINFLFINASNQLGGFESGATAALLGTVFATALGGVATITIALAWMALFPVLRRFDRLE